ncbi:MAG TPA: GntR family transcriptional regulator [Bacillota bacterium]|nr:GntR family transcriptional regulator [Bacillota bacterium]
MPTPKNFSKLSRTSIKENVFKQLQQRIIDGTFQPGETINDKELADALGVSRTPVREALQLLEVQDFVKMYPGRATQVTEVEKDSIEDLLPPLAVLQALAAELAIPYLTDDILSSLHNTNERFAQAIHKEDFFTALKIDEEYHQLIVDTANNPYLDKVIGSLQPHVRRLFFHNSIIMTEKSINDHHEIMICMKNKDRTKAASIMRENWLRTVHAFRNNGMK